MQPATTRTMASVGASIVGSGTSERRMSPGAWIVVARMVAILPPHASRGHACRGSAAGAEPEVGQPWGGKRVVPLLREGAVGGRAARLPRLLPGLAEADDLVVGATDEVPPHDDLLAEGRATEHEEARRLVRARLDGDPRAAGALEDDLAGLGGR